MLQDQLHRPLRDLRISVTDRCNFRCTYCMPFDHYDWIHKREILTYEEICRTVRLAVPLGVRKIRLTGGEPLLRRDLPDLVRQLSGIEGIEDIALTTNGSRLSGMAGALRAAGLRRINVSIDSLDPERFRRVTKRGDLDDVLKGLFAAREAGLAPIKINAVIERGVNEEDILPLVEFGREHGFVIRFIEYMDVGTANAWRLERTVPKAEILERIGARYPLEPIGRGEGNAPAVDYAFRDGKGTVGIVASVTEPFCGTCSRGRLTADGRLVTCLFSRTGHDLKARLRSDAGDDDIRDWMAAVWAGRTDRFSADRLHAIQSPDGYDPEQHDKIEMITLGG
ncbi:MAG: GTP 3',8-cyclase MoaA [Deltaproteobacteria bacterium]|nr:GTP 3',8-cyclase MoaA [Deltaproteobacteria bacterium]